MDREDWDNDDDLDPDEDRWAELEANCGQSPDGRCQLSGTSYCDWTCPFSEELKLNRKRRHVDARQGCMTV
jgi:hypothetical protein